VAVSTYAEIRFNESPYDLKVSRVSILVEQSRLRKDNELFGIQGTLPS